MLENITFSLTIAGGNNTRNVLSIGKFRRNLSDWIIEGKQFSLSLPIWLSVRKPLEISDCDKVT